MIVSHQVEVMSGVQTEGRAGMGGGVGCGLNNDQRLTPYGKLKKVPAKLQALFPFFSANWQDSLSILALVL